MVASGENIFEPTSKTQKTWLRIVQKYTTENTIATPCTYSGKLQFANTHCGNVFIISFRKFSQNFFGKKNRILGEGFSRIVHKSDFFIKIESVYWQDRIVEMTRKRQSNKMPSKHHNRKLLRRGFILLIQVYSFLESQC